MSVKRWCEENGVTTKTYYTWQKKVFTAMMEQQRTHHPGGVWLLRCGDRAADSGESMPAILLRGPVFQRREAALRPVDNGVLPKAPDTGDIRGDQ